MVGVLVVILGVVVAVVAIVALHAPNGHKNKAVTGNPTSSISQSRTSRPSGTPTTKPTTRSNSSSSSSSSSSSTPNPKSVPLVVLNNTTTPNLASQAATRFRSGGWTVTSFGNLTNDIISTCAYYDPDTAGAKAAAQALQAQYPTIKRVEPKFDGLPAGPVVVVLTPDYSAS